MTLNCVLNIERDKVFVQKDRLIIHAAEPMDLPVREFCRVPVYFQGAKYFVSSKRVGEGGCAEVYELRPWPADLRESSNRHVVYDENYVVERE